MVPMDFFTSKTVFKDTGGDTSQCCQIIHLYVPDGVDSKSSRDRGLRSFAHLDPDLG